MSILGQEGLPCGTLGFWDQMGAVPQTPFVSYAAGLMFDRCRRNVVMIRKQKPAFMRGRLNAVGGKLDPQDRGDAKAAMIREFREEAGVEFTAWKFFCQLRGSDFCVSFFRAFDDAAFEMAQSQEDEVEEIEKHRVKDLLHYHGLFDNLRVIIPLALDTSGLVMPVYLQDRKPNERSGDDDDDGDGED